MVIANGVRVNIDWIDSELFEKENALLQDLQHVSGILVQEVSVNVVLKSARYALLVMNILTHLFWHANGGSGNRAQSGQYADAGS